MRVPPKLSQFHRFPVVSGIALLAIGVTVASWGKVDISPLFETAMIRRGELWRLVTSILPHSGTLHLIFNLYWLWVFGTLIEEAFGHFKTLALILLLAFASSSWEFGLASGGIGLSGVGYGLFGMLWMLSRRDERFRDAVDDRTLQLFVVWFFFCVVLTLTHVMPIGNIAHASGALFGILIGLAITMPDYRSFICATISGILLTGLWAATFGRPKVNFSGIGGFEEEQWGYALLANNKDNEALRWLKDAVVFQPKNAEYLYNLSIAYHRLGNDPAAVTCVRKSAALGDPDAQYLLGAMYQVGNYGLQKDTSQAMYWYRKSVEHDDPGVLNNVAWALVTSTDSAIRNPNLALQYARRAVDLEKGHPDANYLDTLAEALFASGQFQQAIDVEQQAIAMAPKDGKNNFQKSLARYQLALKGGSVKLGK